MNLTIANISTKVNSADFHAAVNTAVGSDVNHCYFSPEWGTSATLRGTALSIARNNQGQHAIAWLVISHGGSHHRSSKEPL